jgi:5-methylcytosine-specific restriction endonuclease McrA
VTALCQCGCGRPAPIAKQTRDWLGHVKGQPIRFIRGHHGRRPDADPLRRGWAEARRLYPIEGQVCDECADAPALDHHHRDGDPTNNARENVRLLCRRCHMVEDGRIEMSRLPPNERAGFR